MGPEIITKRPHELNRKTAAQVNGNYIVFIDYPSDVAASGMLFSEFAASISAQLTFKNLSDVADYAGNADKVVIVNPTGTGITYGYKLEKDVPSDAVFTDTTYSANDMLTSIKTVDGPGSGLDADLLDGKQSSVSSSANTIPIRDASQWLFAVNFDTGSDIRWKFDIKRLKEGTKGMIPKSYKMKDGNGDILYGFIAQELRKTHPELVHENKKGYLTISMNGIIPLLVNDINRLRKFNLIYQISRIFNKIFKRWQ